MRNRLFVTIFGIVFVVALLAPGARGLSLPRSAPQSVPVAVSVNASSRATGFGNHATRLGTAYVGVNVSRSIIDPAANNYFVYVSVCGYNHCTSMVNVSGATQRSEFTSPLSGRSLRFHKDTPCGVVDVTFTRTSKPKLSGSQGMSQDGFGLMSAWFGRSLDASASAVGTVCGHSFNSTSGSLDSWAGADVRVGKQKTHVLPR